MRAPVTAVLLLVCAGAGCSQEPPPSFDTAVAGLRACPVGDGPWRETLDLVETEEHWSALEVLTTDLATACGERWEPLWLLGKCHRRSGAAEPSETFGRALERARALGDPVGVAGCANDLGWLAGLAGEPERAEAYYAEGLEAAASARRIDLESFIYNNLARLKMTAGDFPAARDALERAEQGLLALGREGQARWVQQNRASILFELGDAVAAGELLEQLHREAEQAADVWTLDASALLLGNLQLARDDPAGARSWYARVSRVDADLADLTDEGLGRAALLDNDPRQAIEILEQAAGRARPRDVERALVIESLWADALRRGGAPDEAREKLEAIVAEGDAIGAGESRWIARSVLGKLLIARGRPEEAIVVLERALELVEQQRAPLDPVGEGLHFLRQRFEPYVDLAIAVTAAEENPGKAASRILEVLRRGQARALRHGLAPQAAAPSVHGLQSSLGQGELLVNYLLGEEGGILLVLGRRSVRAVPIPGRRALLGDLRTYRDALRRPVVGAGGSPGLGASEREAGLRLRRALVDPIGPDLLRNARRLYVVPDRELALLPFAALPDDEAASFLGHRIETAVMPLAGAAPGWSGKRSPVLLAGLPEGTTRPELPWAAYELSRLGELWDGGRSTLLSGDAFTPDGLRQAQPRGFRTLHMASHAEASTLDPRRCGVVMSGDVMLGIEQVAGLDLDDALVVLSACRTGEGELLPGEGVIGLGWAFLRAGARGIVVSQWTVDDVASARLMVAFHRGLRDGEDPVRALAAAGREIARTHPHPAYWAPFVIVLRPS